MWVNGRVEVGGGQVVELPALLIIRLIIQTIRRDSSGPVQIDEASNVSRPDPSGADQINAEHQATDLPVGGSNPSRCAKGTGQRYCSKRSRKHPILGLIIPCRHAVTIDAVRPTSRKRPAPVPDGLDARGDQDAGLMLRF
jgi:hypothetical protein